MTTTKLKKSAAPATATRPGAARGVDGIAHRGRLHSLSGKLSDAMCRKLVRALIEMDHVTACGADPFRLGGALHEDAWRTMSSALVPAWQTVRNEELAKREVAQ
jgi:hypothetical protein